MDKSGTSVAHRESADVGHRSEGGFDNEMREKSSQLSTESHRVDPCDPNDPNGKLSMSPHSGRRSNVRGLVIELALMGEIQGL
jgi:hypothetical protein